MFTVPEYNHRMEKTEVKQCTVRTHIKAKEIRVWSRKHMRK